MASLLNKPRNGPTNVDQPGIGGSLTATELGSSGFPNGLLGSGGQKATGGSSGVALLAMDGQKATGVGGESETLRGSMENLSIVPPD